MWEIYKTVTYHFNPDNMRQHYITNKGINRPYEKEYSVLEHEYMDILKKLVCPYARLRLSEEDLATLKHIADKL